MMPALHKPHQTVAGNGCITFCKTTCGFFKPQILQFYLEYLQDEDWLHREKVINPDIIVQFLVGSSNDAKMKHVVM